MKRFTPFSSLLVIFAAPIFGQPVAVDQSMPAARTQSSTSIVVLPQDDETYQGRQASDLVLLREDSADILEEVIFVDDDPDGRLPGIPWEGFLDGTLVSGRLMIFDGQKDGTYEFRLALTVDEESTAPIFVMEMGEDDLHDVLDDLQVYFSDYATDYCGCNNKNTLCAKDKYCDEGGHACPNVPGKYCQWFNAYALE